MSAASASTVLSSQRRDSRRRVETFFVADMLVLPAPCEACVIWVSTVSDLWARFKHRKRLSFAPQFTASACAHAEGAAKATRRCRTMIRQPVTAPSSKTLARTIHTMRPTALRIAKAPRARPSRERNTGAQLRWRGRDTSASSMVHRTRSSTASVTLPGGSSSSINSRRSSASSRSSGSKWA